MTTNTSRARTILAGQERAGRREPGRDAALQEVVELLPAAFGEFAAEPVRYRVAK